jgi:2-hydroxymuconate-semialdehyde hydrolase
LIRLGGVSTAVLEGGDGPPLVLLQGGIECGGAYWAPLLARLADRHRLVVPDLPGLGESEPFPRLDPAVFDDWLAALIDATCGEPPTLIAHSLDGSLAARFAARHGDLIRSLVIYAAPGVGPYRMPFRLRVLAVRFGLRPTERNAERFDRFAFFDLDRARRRDPDWLRAFAEYTRSRASVRHVKRTMQQLVKAGTKQVPDAELRRIGVPTTLVWGRHDRFVPLSVAEDASGRLGWPLHVIDDAGHVPHIEQPEAFCAVVSPAASPRPDRHRAVR